ncbi:MAG TPA: GNAT family N-acetyltransferase [Acidimicrobiales bacterium]
MSPLRIERCDPEASPAAGLLADMVVELNAAYGVPNRLAVPAVEPSDLRPPRGTYLVGYEGDAAVASGGLRSFAEGVAEIKRMFVRPEARSKGYAAEMLAAIEEVAWSMGYRRACLDTGPKQVHAQALYRRAGYAEVAPFNDNPFACFWGEKMLRQPG